MFGKLSKDQIRDGVKKGLEFFIPIGEFGKVDEIAGQGRVSKPASFMDFLQVAKRRFRKANPIAPNQADIVQWILYDRQSFAAASTIPNVVRLFSQPINTANKTKVDTNLEYVSQLTPPQWMNVTGLGFYFANSVTGPDLDAFFATEYMEFWITQKIYLEGPLQNFPSGAGRFGSSNLGTMTAAAANFTSNQGSGWPTVQNLFDVRLPAGLNLGLDSGGNSILADGLIGITILQGQNFYVLLKADAGGATLLANNAAPVPGTGLTVQCAIHGVLSRQVQ